ncbi:MAG: VWA domain-containing protein [Bacteroidota bacterium]|nr:VWA domain-containing protein [Bacteroidota bacterium]
MSLFIGSYGQINIQSKKIDLGTIEQFNNDTVVFLFKNETPQTVYLLSTQPADNYQIITDKKKVISGETIQIGVVLYVENKGKINYSIPVYFSHLNDAILLGISGNIKSIHPNAIDKCPSIENSAPLKINQVPLKVIVKDKETLKLLGGAKVEVQFKNQSVFCAQGFNQLTYQCKCDEGFLNIKVSLKGYIPQSLNFNFYRENNVVEVFLEKVLVEENEIDTIVKTPQPTELIVYEPVGLTKKLDNTLYMPNHLIFVIDISGSMKDSFKLNFMKASMIALAKELRSTDYFTLITYAGRAKVVLEFTSGMNLEDIKTSIDTLQAKGGSYGADGLLNAYQKANQYFIKNANNQVFLATDGLFNGGNLKNEDLYKIAKKEFQKNQIKLSTIGFGKDEKALVFLKKLAENGNGHYLVIHQLPQDLDVLIEEVKKQSKISQ